MARERRAEATRIQRIRRAAYRDVTALRTWPLQELALGDLDGLMGAHLGDRGGGEGGASGGEDGAGPPLTGCGFASDSSGVSNSSVEEPKRPRRPRHRQRGRDCDGGRPSLGPEEDASPGKAALRRSFREEFLAERAMAGPPPPPRSPAPAPAGGGFLPSLWSMEPRIFSVERSGGGRRRYLVGHLGRFLDHYWRKADSRRRHYYELIREGTPCRLYLDLEYGRGANPDIEDGDGDLMVEELIAELREALRSIHGLAVPREAVADLDSSTQTKFSRHLVFHLPGGSLFADAGAVGTFVRGVVARLADDLAAGKLAARRPALAANLFLRTGSSPRRGGRERMTTTTTSTSRRGRKGGRKGSGRLPVGAAAGPRSFGGAHHLLRRPWSVHPQQTLPPPWVGQVRQAALSGPEDR